MPGVGHMHLEVPWESLFGPKLKIYVKITYYEHFLFLEKFWLLVIFGTLFSEICPFHCALGAILDLLYKSKTSGGKVMKFTPSYTFTKRNILVKKFWPLKARKAMLK